MFLSGYWLLTVSAQSVNFPTIVKIVAGGDPTPIGGVFASDGTLAFGLGQSSPGSLDSTVFYATVADKVGARQNSMQPVTPDASLPPFRLGIFRTLNGQISKIATTGDPAPGGGKFVALYSPVTNVGGDVAFGAIVQRQDESLEEGAFLAVKGNITATAAARKLDKITDASVLSPALKGIRCVAHEYEWRGGVYCDT